MWARVGAWVVSVTWAALSHVGRTRRTVLSWSAGLRVVSHTSRPTALQTGRQHRGRWPFSNLPICRRLRGH